MPVSGLIALLDDIAAISDDVATLTAMAAKKTTGVVTDDMAVTAEQAIGIRREREIPVVLAVARGSLFNKAVILAPGALLLNAVAPWAIHPILMAGGSYLAFEGVEKLLHRYLPHDTDGDGTDDDVTPDDPEAFEAMRVGGAIRTDLILSGEIIAITLGEVSSEPFLTQAGVLYAISLVMTAGVYGMVAGLVKIDDLGEHLVTRGGSRAKVGARIVAAAPTLLHLISTIGTYAMLMVGGHILLEGIHPLEEAVHHLLAAVPAFFAGPLGLVIDVVVGFVAGAILCGVVATGLPRRVANLVRRPAPKPASEGAASKAGSTPAAARSEGGPSEPPISN